MNSPIKIKINNESYWFLRGSDGGGAIAYMDHCDENGNLKVESACEESFAHVYPEGYISRFGKNIGNIKDFLPHENLR